MKRLLAPTQSAAASDEFVVADVSNGATFSVTPPLGSGEVATLQKKNADGDWDNVYSGEGLEQLHENKSVLSVYGFGVYRINKGATASDTAVEVSEASNP